MPPVLADLKRRRVFHTMAVYGAASFAALEGLSLLQPVLMVPEWGYRLAGFLVLVGLPIVVILTWLYDVDIQQGVVRTPPATPEELAAIVRLPRTRRWPSGVLGLAGLVLLSGSAWYALVPEEVHVPGTRHRPTLAVLPLEARTDLAEDGFFIDGLHDDILIQLSRDPALRLISRTSVGRFRGTTLSLPAVADSLGASLIMEGAVQRAGDTVRVSVQLIDGRTDAHLWAGRWDEALSAETTLFLQEAVAQDIASAVARVVAGLHTTFAAGAGSRDRSAAGDEILR